MSAMCKCVPVSPREAPEIKSLNILSITVTMGMTAQVCRTLNHLLINLQYLIFVKTKVRCLGLLSARGSKFHIWRYCSDLYSKKHTGYSSQEKTQQPNSRYKQSCHLERPTQHVLRHRTYSIRHLVDTKSHCENSDESSWMYGLNLKISQKLMCGSLDVQCRGIVRKHLGNG